jgi:hypothetical protein
MRSDMGKVLIDCGRLGHKSDQSMYQKLSAPKYGVDWESAPNKQAMSRGRGTKQFCDRISPLIRWLNSQVGRRWNDVWSEVSKLFPASGTMQLHIRGHLDELVEKHVQVRKGRLWAMDDYPRQLGEYRATLYVCPRTGILKKLAAPVIPEKTSTWVDGNKSAKLARFDWQYKEFRVCFPNGREAEYVKGVWYFYTWVTVDSDPRSWDWPSGDIVRGKYAQRGKQLSKKELKRLIPRQIRYGRPG